MMVMFLEDVLRSALGGRWLFCSCKDDVLIYSV